MEFVVFAALPIKKLLNKPNLNVVTRKKKTPYQDKKKSFKFFKKKISSPIFFVINFNLAIRFEKNPKHER
jgi:hypothetical protein